MERPSWDEYFINVTKETSKCSNCIKKSVGCIIVKDSRIIGLGYNGTPKGYTNCYLGGCERCNLQYKMRQEGLEYKSTLQNCICIHAELNAILMADSSSLVGSVLYNTLEPCIECAKVIVQVGIKRVVYIEEYKKSDNCDLREKLYKSSKVNCEKFFKR